MSNCSQCGSTIPEGQRICSMCMGDISHGSDGYYEEWAREQHQIELEKEAAQYEADQIERERQRYRNEQQDAFGRDEQAQWEAEQNAPGEFESGQYQDEY